MTLVGFYAWWAGRVTGSMDQGARSTGQGAGSSEQGAGNAAQGVGHPGYISKAFTIAAVMVAASGLVFDVSGEGLLTLVLVEHAAASNPVAFADVERAFTLLSAGGANGLYTLGGMLLTLATPDLPRWVRSAMWATWIAGGAMTVAGLLDHVGGMVASTVVLFPLLICWTVWMGAKWRTNDK